MREGRLHRDKPGYQRLMKDPSKFRTETFEALAKDLKSGKIPLPKVMLTDPVQPGLRVLIRQSGTITFIAHYTVGDRRPMLTIGEHPEMTIEEARPLVRTINALADKGVDVQEGLHTRLLKELRAKGEKWKL
jgi:hypothetical protein